MEKIDEYRLLVPNKWIVFFARSDWLLKLEIVSAIHLPALFWISRASLSSFLRNKELHAGFPLVCYMLAVGGKW